MNKKLFSLGLSLSLLAANAVHAEEALNKKTLFDRILGSIAQSRPMNKLNLFLASHIELQGPPARPEFQKMGADAQTAVGIPVKRQVPVRQFKDMEEGDACTEYEAIYLDEDTFNSTENPYGFKRCTIYHEAVHVKYNDYRSDRLIKIAGLMSGLFLTKILNPQGALKILYPISSSTGYFVGKLLAQKYLRYCERRADIEGHYATQCAACVQESADHLRKELTSLHEQLAMFRDNKDIQNADGELITPFDREALINEGQNCINEFNKRYLSPDELDKIALDLKQQNKLCAFHSAQQAANNN